MSSERQQILAGIAAIEQQRALLGDAVVDASLAGLRAKLTALDALPREPVPKPEPAQTLKQISILFLDSVGSTRLSQHLDPEEDFALMHSALTRGAAIVESHGGVVLQYAGDSLLAVFGGNQVREDDAERAVRCGLALLELGRTLAAEVLARHGHAGFNVRVGIHTGGVLLSEGLGPEGAIRGMAVNVAARMEQTAPAGALRISHETYTHVRGMFEVLAQDPLTVKGVDTPVQTYLVQRARPRSFRIATHGIEGIATRMIGRDVELEQLQDVFKRLLAERQLAAVTVIAEAGLGKTRLLAEFEAWAEVRPETFFLFRGRATPQTQSQPFGLLRDILTWRFQIADDDTLQVARKKIEQGIIPLFAHDESDLAEGHAHLLGHLIGIDWRDSPHLSGILQDPKQIRNRALHTAAQMFRRLSASDGSPVILELEDLHWADNESLDFLNYLTEMDRDIPLLILAFTRPTLFERRTDWKCVEARHLQIELLPLDRAASHMLANELLRKVSEVPAALRELLINGAEGNPFYMEELVLMLIDQGAITTGEVWSLDASKLLATKVPATLAGVVQARLDGLPAPEKLTLQKASVIGPVFWDLALLALDGEAEHTLPSLARRGLLTRAKGDATPDGLREYAFKHQILHQVTYSTLLKKTKRELHGTLARWLVSKPGLRANDFLGVAAEHYEKAGDTRNACEYFIRAAEHAADTFANEASLEYIERGLKLTSDEDIKMRWRLYASRERILDLQGRRIEQRANIESLKQLAESLDDDGLRGEVAWRLADIAMRTGDNAMCETEARRTLMIAERQGAEELALRAEVRLSTALATQGKPVEGEEIAIKGRARARDLGLKRLEVQFTNCLGICSELTGNLGQQLAYSLQQLALGREIGDRRIEAVTVSNAGAIFLRLGDDAQASLHLDEGLRLARVLGIRETEGHVLCSMSELSLRRGEALQARVHAQTALQIAIEVRARYNEIFGLAALGNAELALRRWKAAAASFERMESLAREASYPAAVLDAIDGLTRLALARGAIRRSAHALNRLLEYAQARDEAAGGRGGQLAGSMEHWIRLTTYKVWARSGDPRAEAALVSAYTALQSEASAIRDETWRRSFLENIPEHREISALWEASRQATSGRGLS